jgi:hypothetical protein
MKRVSDKETKLQEGDLLFLVGQIPPFIEAFRYHPVRLLRLLDSNKGMRQVFDKMATQYKKDIWYYLCIHAFPNEMLMLESMSQVAPYGEIHGYAYQECMENYFFKLKGDENYLANYKKEMRTRHDKKIDRSFLSPALRKQCLENATIARQTAEAFKILYPFGTPPAEYCFSSHMALQRLMLSYFTFLCNIPFLSPRNASPEENFVKFFHQIGLYTHSLVTRIDFGIYEFEEFREQMSVDDCLKIIMEPNAVVEANGLGPRDIIRTDFSRQGYQYDDLGVINQPAFTLVSLEKNILYCLKNGKPGGKSGRPFKEEEMIVLREMHREVLFQIILSTEEEELKMYSNQEVFEEAVAQRKHYVSKYGTVDPLYWSLLRGGDARDMSDAFLLWEPVFRTIVKEMLARVPDRPDDRVDYLDMTCHHCGDVATHIQDAAPFHMYCSDACHSLNYSNHKNCK